MVPNIGFYPNCLWLLSVEPPNKRRSDREISTQFPFGMFFATPIQEPSNNRENNGKNGDYERTKGNDKFVVVGSPLNNDSENFIYPALIMIFFLFAPAVGLLLSTVGRCTWAGFSLIGIWFALI